MASLKIKKGDHVIVIAGRDKGKHGEVVEMFPKEERAIVRGVNVVRRHQKQTAALEGGIISKEAPIHVSNLAREGQACGNVEMLRKKEAAIVRGVNVVRRHQKQTAASERRHHLPKKRRSICRSGSKIPRTARPRASASSSWPTARRFASPSAPAKSFQRDKSMAIKRNRRRPLAPPRLERRRRSSAKRRLQLPGAAGPSRAAPQGLQAAHEGALRERSAR